MPRCPHCRGPIAESTGKCPHCRHDLDKHAWLLGSLGDGRTRRRAAGLGLAVAAALLFFVVLRIW